MDVTLTPPISVTVTTAKLVLEDEGRGTIQFTIMDQPVRLNILSTGYVYDTTIAVGDRVELIQNFGAFGANSSGIVQKIIVSCTQDTVSILFDKIYPDQTINPVQAQVKSTVTSILYTVPINIVQKA